MNYFKPSTIKDIYKLEDKLAELAQRVYEAGLILVEKESQFRYLDSMEKIILNENTPSEGSVKDREKYAKTSNTYKTHIIAIEESRKEYLQALYNYKNEERRHDDIKLILMKRFSSLT